MTAEVSMEERERIIDLFKYYSPGLGERVQSAAISRTVEEKTAVWYSFAWDNVFEFVDFLDPILRLLRGNKNFRRLIVTTGMIDPDKYYAAIVMIPKSMLRRVKA